ncbi:unnamed protein product [Arctogadus glacialis]
MPIHLWYLSTIDHAIQTPLRRSARCGRTHGIRRDVLANTVEKGKETQSVGASERQSLGELEVEAWMLLGYGLMHREWKQAVLGICLKLSSNHYMSCDRGLIASRRTSSAVFYEAAVRVRSPGV